jgi:hypothetical protein
MSGNLAAGNEFDPAAVQFAKRPFKWHTPGVLDILKWKKVENIFTAFGQTQIIGKLFRCSS